MKKLLLFFASLLMLVACNSRPECAINETCLLQDSSSTTVKVYVEGLPFSGYAWSNDERFFVRSREDTLFKMTMYYDNSTQPAISEYYPELRVYYNIKGDEIPQREFNALYPELESEFEKYKSSIAIRKF